MTVTEMTRKGMALLLAGVTLLLVAGCEPQVEECEPGVAEISEINTAIPECN